MQNWEVAQKKISEMSKDEFIRFTCTPFKIKSYAELCGLKYDCSKMSCEIKICSECIRDLLEKEYQPPKQEKWIVHRTLRMNGMETYVGYSDDDVDDGCRKYFLGTFDGKNISGYLHKLKAHKFDYLEAIVLREQLNKQRAYKQYLWVISKVEE